MKNSNDIILLEKSMEHSTLIFGLCKLLPEDEPTIIHILKESAINQSTYLKQLIDSTSNEESMFYLDNVKGNMFRMRTTLELTCRLGYINSNDLKDFDSQINNMLVIVDERISHLSDDIEKERLNISMCLPDILKTGKLLGGKRLES